MLKKYWWVMVALALPVLPSCLKSDPVPTRIVALGKTQCNPQDSTEWWFMADDSLTFVPSEPLSYTPPRNFRAIAIMELSEAKKIGYDYVVRLEELRGVITQAVTTTSAASIDTFTNNDIKVAQAYISLQYLNISVSTWGNKQEVHTFSLLRDSAQVDEPIKLVFRHNAHNDNQYNQLSGVLSFDLETLAERSTQDSVRVALITPAGDSACYTYRFHR